MTLNSLLSVALLSFAIVHASPFVQIREWPIILPVNTQINMAGGGAALIKVERARFARIGNKPSLRKLTNLPALTKDIGFLYTCDVGNGNPPTTYTLMVDTGSSNTWVGARNQYVATSTSRKTLDSVSVNYGSGSFEGDEYTDTVTIASAAIRSQSIGVALEASGFGGIDGILGVGPVDLTLTTLSPDKAATIPTVTDNLKSQRFISTNQVGISFEPTTFPNPSTSGELDFGGIDSSKYTGYLNYVPVTLEPPASRYWGINQGITYGSSTAILSPSSVGIVDTGTTFLYLNSDAFSRYQSATHATPDDATGLLEISCSDFDKLESLFFTIGGVKLEFTANAQIWPRHLNPAIGGSSSSIYLIVADSGSTIETGLDFVNGFVWLQRFYTVFDTDNRRVGFATTPFTNAKTN